jgi:hypothetical protein
MECGLTDTFSTRKPTNRNNKIEILKFKERHGICVDVLLSAFTIPGFILRK